jgi:WhiB family transcriptional regulator, redox-sensing transcriptional regulator
MSVGDLLGIVGGLGDWADDAACREVGDWAMFFPERGGSPALAKTVCARCPVRDECLDYALDHHIRERGVWGGMTEKERAALLRSRRAA